MMDGSTNRHVMRHLGEGDFACPLCGYKIRINMETGDFKVIAEGYVDALHVASNIAEVSGEFDA